MDVFYFESNLFDCPTTKFQKRKVHLRILKFYLREE